MTVVELFRSVKNTAGTLAKKQLLSENLNPLVHAIFEATYGEHKYFVTKLDIKNCRDLTIEEGWEDFKQVLFQCENHHISGNDAREALSYELERYTEDDQEILMNVIQHNLKIGISLDNWLSIIGKPIDKFEVSLAHNLKDVKNVDPVDGTYFASRKLDGVRCVAIVNVDKNGNASTPIFKSRQNKEFTTLSNLVKPVKKLAQGLPEGQYMFDGECCILDENGDEHFDWVMKEITRKNHTILNPCYNIFDFLPAEVFYGKEESLSFSERLDQIHILMEKYIEDGGDKDRIHILHQEKLMNQSDFDRWSQYVKEGNWEGFMLRKDTTYKGGRSKDLIKVKLFQDAEYKVVGTTNGTATYNEGGQKEIPVCSALIVEHKGNQVFVGTGLSKEQRILWLDHPEEIVGKTITVQYFEETKDSKTGEYSLRFPVLKCVYDNGRNI